MVLCAFAVPLVFTDTMHKQTTPTPQPPEGAPPLAVDASKRALEAPRFDPPPQPDDDEAWDEAICGWAGQTRWAVSQVVAAHVRVGRVLAEAKRSLPHGQFGRLLENPGMPFGVRQSQKLIKISTHPVLSDTRNYLRLPAAVDSLSLLASVDPGTLRRGIADGRVRRQMSIAQVKLFVRKHPDRYSSRHARRRVGG